MSEAICGPNLEIEKASEISYTSIIDFDLQKEKEVIK